jgi:hypothetical protein
MPDFAPYAGAAEAVAGLLNGIVKRVLPEKMSEVDAAKMNQEITMALLRGELEPALQQLRVNEAEARHESVFVAGWRPFIGWICGVALGWQFIGLQIALFVAATMKTEIGPLPQFDYATLSPILLGMLGLGGLRTYEKIRGVTETKVGK